ncbi:SF1B family DNA helicase RecD2 [Desulfitobacterium hafniense]|uniref:SF1B family DNA helicase RecD2 n=1 Tax=Desulfitobacterium hafniense TaxID=49338 RepID=UPI0003643E0F|nr:ATP-dependent RecD-like DNA helicase [Desulfitobacterium hafniense]
MATATRVKKTKEIVKPVTTLAGKIASIRFHNPQNGYSVISIEPRDMMETGMVSCSAVGNLAAVRIGDEYEFAGEWKEHPQYGKQFAFCKADVVLPKEKTGAANYLATLAYGVGFAKAKRIVDALGDDALNRIIEDPGVLVKFDFLTIAQRAEITEGLLKNTKLAELAALICKEGVGIGTAVKIYNTYGQDSMETVKENPYILADEVFGIGFKIADRIAMSVGIAPDSPYRVRAAYQYALKEAENEGHVFLTPKETMQQIGKLLGKHSMVGVDHVKAAFEELEKQGVVFRDRDAIYLQEMYGDEVSLAKDIARLAQIPGKYITSEGFKNIDAIIEEIEMEIGKPYDSEQKAAIKKSFEKSLSIVTGGPGTGKTTVENGIIRAYKKIAQNNVIILAAPTGAASERMLESTGIEAHTEHQQLGYNPLENKFQYNRNNKLPAGLLIVDEFSMNDLALSARLFEAIPDDMVVVIVGDVDQLPSVGPGKVLEDMIESGQVTTTRLKFNYRQAAGSRIAQEAYNVIENGQCTLYDNENDWKTTIVNDPEGALESVKAEVYEALIKGFGIMDFQILIPMKKGICGIDHVNEVIRDIVNPPSPSKAEYKLGKDRIIRVQDKVMVTKRNFKKLGLSNGDIGIVKAIYSNSMVVDFRFKGEVTINEEVIHNLKLAYASTIHKSQGLEFPINIMVIMMCHYIMLQKNLYYTGMTRTKEKLNLVCQEEAVKRCLDNTAKKKRNTLLKDRIIAYAGAKPSQSA